MSRRARWAYVLCGIYHVFAFAAMLWLIAGIGGPIVLAWAALYCSGGIIWALVRNAQEPPSLFDDERG